MYTQTNSVILRHLVAVLERLDVPDYRIKDALIECSLTGFYTDSTVDTSDMQRFWALSSDMSGIDNIGAVAGGLVQPALLSSLGLAMLTSKNLYEGINRFVTFSGQFSEGYTVALQSNGDETVDASISILIEKADRSIVFSKHAIDFFIATIERLVGVTSMESAKPDARHNYMRAPKVLPDGTDELDGDLLAEIVYSREVMYKKLPNTDDYYTRIHEEQLMRFDRLEGGRQFSDQVAREIDNAMGLNATAEKVAQHFNMSSRTFHRKLAKEGEGFSKLMQRLKFGRAVCALKKEHHSVTATALMLGYDDVGSFSKAFRRWSGQSPSTFVRMSM